MAEDAAEKPEYVDIASSLSWCPSMAAPPAPGPARVPDLPTEHSSTTCGYRDREHAGR